jgi:hypothetical protein
MAMLPPDKRARLFDLDAFRRRLPQVSQSALAALIRIVRDEGLPEMGDDRNNFTDARDAIVQAPTEYGPMLQTVRLVLKSGGDILIDVIHPLAFLWTAANQAGGFSAYLEALVRDDPPRADQPWRLLLYTDEITPGNAVSYNNKRKVHVLYWSMLSLGIYELSHEDAWFPMCTVRSDIIKNVHAGLSRLGFFGKTLRLTLCVGTCRWIFW